MYHLTPMAEFRPVGVIRYTTIIVEITNRSETNLHPSISLYAYIRIYNETATALIPLLGNEEATLAHTKTRSPKNRNSSNYRSHIVTTRRAVAAEAVSM